MYLFTFISGLSQMIRSDRASESEKTGTLSINKAHTPYPIGSARQPAALSMTT